MLESYSIRQTLLQDMRPLSVPMDVINGFLPRYDPELMLSRAHLETSCPAALMPTFESVAATLLGVPQNDRYSLPWMDQKTFVKPENGFTTLCWTKGLRGVIKRSNPYLSRLGS